MNEHKKKNEQANEKHKPINPSSSLIIVHEGQLSIMWLPISYAERDSSGDRFKGRGFESREGKLGTVFFYCAPIFEIAVIVVSRDTDRRFDQPLDHGTPDSSFVSLQR